MGQGEVTDQYSEEEAARRRDQALKRALKMPPKPHKPKARKVQRQTKTKQSAT